MAPDKPHETAAEAQAKAAARDQAREDRAETRAENRAEDKAAAAAAAAPAPAAPPPTPPPAATAAPPPKPIGDPFRPVTVKNHGKNAWYGSDFKPVGPGLIEAGGIGVVTYQKAQQLVADYGPDGKDGRGPFEIVE